MTYNNQHLTNIKKFGESKQKSALQSMQKQIAEMQEQLKGELDPYKFEVAEHKAREVLRYISEARQYHYCSHMIQETEVK